MQMKISILLVLSYINISTCSIFLPFFKNDGNDEDNKQENRLFSPYSDLIQNEQAFRNNTPYNHATASQSFENSEEYSKYLEYQAELYNAAASFLKETKMIEDQIIDEYRRQVDEVKASFLNNFLNQQPKGNSPSNSNVKNLFIRQPPYIPLRFKSRPIFPPAIHLRKQPNQFDNQTEELDNSESP